MILLFYYVIFPRELQQTARAHRLVRHESPSGPPACGAATAIASSGSVRVTGSNTSPWSSLLAQRRARNMSNRYLSSGNRCRVPPPIGCSWSDWKTDDNLLFPNESVGKVAKKCKFPVMERGFDEIAM